MKKLVTTLTIKSKLDIRSSDILITNYIVPILFFFVMGAVFSNIMPESKQTLIASMSIFAMTMGATIGISASISEYFKNDIRKTMVVSKIPFSSIIVTSIVSGFIHLFIVSMIITFLAPILYGATPIDSFPIYLASLSLSIFITVLLGIIIGLVSKNTAQLTIFAQLVFLPSMMLSGIMFPATMLPSILRSIGSVLPATQSMMLLTSESLQLETVMILMSMILVFSIVIAFLLKRLKLEDSN